MSHHSSQGPFDEKPMSELIEKPMSELMRQVFGEHPDGKLLALIVGRENNRVVIQFPKPVKWIGFTADEAVGLANRLIEHARKCGSTTPLVVEVGGKP